tara:strand:- start:522 stop:1649 length:1128 start_codon:yes stop_codon:yes gene_type:complete
MIETEAQQQLKTFAVNLHTAIVQQDAKPFAALMKEKMTEVKTKKATGPKSSVGNATLMVRFAKTCGIENPLVASYYGGNSGPNATNDISNLQQIAGGIVKKFLDRTDINDATDLYSALTAWVDSFNGPIESPKPQPKSTMPSIVSTMPSIDNDEDFDDEEEEEEEVATATESKPLIFKDFDVETKMAIKAVTDEQIIRAKEVLLKTNKNGEGYEMTLSGKKTLTPKNLINLRDWDNQLIKVSADILALAPKRNKKWTDAKTGKSYKTRTWFPELCGAQNYQAAKRFTEQMTAYVILASGRNFWNARFGWTVSEEFRQGFRAFIGVNEEVANSAVVGGQAQSWNWELIKNDWTPTSSSRMTDDDYKNLDIGSLDSL